MFKVQRSKGDMKRGRFLYGACAATLLLSLMMTFGGCAAVGLMSEVVAGGQTIPALYQIKDRPTLVFVDDPAHKLTTTTLATLIAGRIGQALEDQKTLTHVVDPSLIDQMRADHSNFATWPIDKIGKQAGAEQVIYVSVQNWSMLADGGAMFEPTSEVRVKVVDVPSGTRLFPEPTADLGYPVVTQRHHRDILTTDASTATVLARDLAEHAAADVAKLFYEHAGAEPGAKDE